MSETTAPYFSHPSAIIDEGCTIGAGTKIWHFSHIMPNCIIGEKCNIGQNVVVSPEVVLGNNVKVQNNVSLYTGVICADDVFLGPNVVFTNDIRPRSKKYITAVKTLVGKGASIGANSTILAGVKIGQYAMAGIGSVITKDVPDYALVYGNPTKIKGWVNKNGDKLKKINNDTWSDDNGKLYKINADQLTAL
jgi:UDP-2-acetamido-3-amino-2,3-dideoxy-glucuronate N-acetyltransferase